ncbi:hypothetical protein [Oleiagrimonas sp. C23AA]|uniref:hypothetical protein n=1 Tax=Oleiagrimonas sp. C23AA TaxID=2719047 RepID=UPI001420DF37|nr:hypothetical protein [Oleiagrimonas sp. C23AA]NII09464.1 hypothetical protein [Oleiagrimonas sp. C23AA]
MDEIHFLQIQRPVGQGGFHTGSLLWRAFPQRLAPVITGPQFFNWAYDCGSDQLSALATQIEEVRSVRFDVLFLSHLDSDHVVGLDQLLLTASGVDQLVLPYLGDDDWALHLSAAVSDGRLFGSLVDLAADPAGWFGARGVGRVVYIEAGDDNEDSGEAIDGPDRVDPDSHMPEGDDEDLTRVGDDRLPPETKWSRPPRAIHQGDRSSGRAQVDLLGRGAVAAVRVNGKTLNWVLSPFAFKPPAQKMLLFKQQLEHHFGAGRTAKDYAEAARSAVGRRSLRACYDAVWRTHNLHSMALYAGPATVPSGKLRNTAWHGRFVRRMVQPGWVSTGDFDASVQVRRDALLRYYSTYAPMVGQLGLPHHGSDLSFNSALLHAFPDLSCAIAAVGVNSHGHPGLGVQTAVAAWPSIEFVRVDEFASSVYRIGGPVL